jgi:spermidine/putrescine transport system ATP-binding protein
VLGGERQRVALARAFASDPEILFFDEPLSALDYRLRKALEVELKEIHQRTGRTFVYITHSIEEAMVMSDRIAIMQAGRFVQVGPPADIYRSPANRFVAEFLGEVNILTVVQDGGPRFAELGIPAPDPKGAFAVLRPESLRRDQGAFGAEATVVQRNLLGSRTQLHLNAGGTRLIAEVAGNALDLQPGTSARFGFNPSDLAWVDR